MGRSGKFGPVFLGVAARVACFIRGCSAGRQITPIGTDGLDVACVNGMLVNRYDRDRYRLQMIEVLGGG